MAVAVTSVSSDDDLDLSIVPIRALKYSTRQELSRMLNPEQTILSSTGYSRDYKGFAERLDYECIDIRNFQRHENPFMQILDSWELQEGSTCAALLSILEEIERHDVIQDTKNKIISDAKAYLLKRSKVPLQVAEVTSSPERDFPVDNPDHLTVGDVCGESGQTYYDAYVCYADEDRQFVWELSMHLENAGIKLFIKDRDALLGTSEYETYVRLMNERCNRILIILSPEFLKCRECEFQARYAAGLAIEHRQRKLIPVLYKICEIPALLKFVAKVDFTKPDIAHWVWQKLIASIIGSQNSAFVPALATVGQRLPAPPTQPIITFPPTVSMPAMLPPSIDTLSIKSSQPVIIPTTSSSVLQTPATASFSPSTAKSTSPTLHKWFQNLIKPRSTSSVSSTATSGFFSEGSNSLSTTEISRSETFL